MNTKKNNQQQNPARTSEQQQQALTRRQIVRLLLLSSLPASASGVVGLCCGLCGAGHSCHDHGYAAADQVMTSGDAVADREGVL